MWSRFWEEMNGEMTHKELNSACPALSRMLASLTVAREVGEWEDKPHDEDHPEDEEFTHKLAGMDIGLFSSRFGKAFDGYTDRCWWYGIFAMARAMAIGISLGVISDGKTNSGTMTGLYLIDWFVKVFFSPFIDIFDLCNEIMTATLETSQMGTILAFTNGWVSASWLENAFQTFSIIGYIPSFFGTIIETLASMSEWGPEVMYYVYQIGGSLTCIFTGSRLCLQIATGKANIGALKDFCIHIAHDCISHEETPVEKKQRETREAEEAASRSSSFDSNHQGSISKPKESYSQASFSSASISSYTSFTASAVLEYKDGSLLGVHSSRAAPWFDSYSIINMPRSHFNWNAVTAIVNYGQNASGQAVVSSRLEYTPRESISLVPDRLEMPPWRNVVPVQLRIPQQAWAPHAPTVPRAAVPSSQPDLLGRRGAAAPPQAPVGVNDSQHMPGVSMAQQITPPPLPSASNRFRAMLSRSLGRRSSLPSQLQKETGFTSVVPHILNPSNVRKLAGVSR